MFTNLIVSMVNLIISPTYNKITTTYLWHYVNTYNYSKLKFLTTYSFITTWKKFNYFEIFVFKLPLIFCFNLRWSRSFPPAPAPTKTYRLRNTASKSQVLTDVSLLVITYFRTNSHKKNIALTSSLQKAKNRRTRGLNPT